MELSNIVLGLWRLEDLDGEQITDVVNYAVDQGIDTVDQADIYGGYKSQAFFGRALKADNSLREKIKIVTKAGIILPGSEFSKSGIGFYNTSDEHITKSVDQSLFDMGINTIDLLLIHRPDLLSKPRSIDATFKKLKKQGKVLNFGVSNYTPAQFDALQSQMETKLITNQIELSVLNVNALYDGTLDSCIKHQITPMIWSPLGGGALFAESNEKIMSLTKVLSEIGKEHGGAGIDQIALAWIMKHPSKPKVIVGTFKKERIKAAVEASRISLTQEQWYRILIEAQGYPMP